jgi:hypothetical protein
MANRPNEGDKNLRIGLSDVIGVMRKNLNKIKMNNKNFNQIWRLFVGGATILAWGNFYDQIKNKNKALLPQPGGGAIDDKNEILRHINTIQDSISNLEKQLPLNSGYKDQVIIKINELTYELNNLKAIHNKYFSQFENGNINTDPESTLGIYNKYKEQIDNTFKKANTKANELANALDTTTLGESPSAREGNFMDKASLAQGTISKLISEYKEYLASLSSIETCLLINITTSMFILTCIISIFYSIFGNYLITKFSLEERLPKLSKIIKLRVTFQKYYIIINSVFIIIAVLSLIFINIIALFIK